MPEQRGSYKEIKKGRGVMYKITINEGYNGGFLFKQKSEMLEFISCGINNLDGGVDYDNKPKNATITIERVGEEEEEEDSW